MTDRLYLRTRDLALSGGISVQQVRNYTEATFPLRLRVSTSATLSRLSNASRWSRRSLLCVY